MASKTWSYPEDLINKVIVDPTKYTPLDRYLGNKLVKRAGCVVNYTPEMKDEYRRCKDDIHYFARKYCKIITLDHGIQKIAPFDWQDELWDKFTEERFNIVMAARQVGKSVAFWVYAAHYAVFNEDKVIAVLANKGSTAKKMLAGIRRIIENLPFFLQPGCREWNKMSVEFETNTRIIAAATSADSIRGDSVNLLVLEEFAFVKNSAEFMTSTYPVVTAGETSKVIIVSTPNGTSNEFYRIWQKSIAGQSDYVHSLYTWRCRPERGEEWKRKTIARTSERQFQQEMECVTGDTYITIRNKISGKIEKITIEELSKRLNEENSSI